MTLTLEKTKREQLEQLTAEMRSFADEVDGKDGGASAEDIAKLNKMAADVKQLVEDVKEAAVVNGTLDMAKAFLGDLAGRPAGPVTTNGVVVDGASGIVDPRGMTLGEAITKSPAYTDLLAKFSAPEGGLRKSFINDTVLAEVKSFHGGINAKDLITGASSTSGGAFVTNDRYGPVSDLIGERRLTVRDLCTNVTTTSDTFEFVQVTGKTNSAAGVAEATTSDDPAAYGDPASGAKPESSMTFAVVSTPVETIAHLMPISRRAAADAPQVRQLVDSFLLYGLAEEEEDQILNGDGNSPNLDGILQTAGISTVGSAGTDLDAIVDAIRTIQADRRNPTAMVIHPNDWYSTGFLLAKDTAGNYLIGDPSRPIEQVQALWGLQVVVTPAMTENTALVGDFRQAVVADRQQSTIYVTDSHKDWFGRNLLAVLAEERLALGVLDADAFCTVTAL